MIKQFFSIQDLTKEFGGIRALNSLNITIRQGEVHGIIGPNGAGKTTLLNIITGLEKASAGKIIFCDERIDQLSPELIFQKGISRTFQEGKIVSDLNVLENVIIGFSDKEEDRLYGNIFTLFVNKIYQKNKNKKKCKEILNKFELQLIADRWADDLVWYERQLVQIARAIASEPKFLLLDEPTAGMGIDEKRKIEDKLLEVNHNGVTILLVSHDIQFIRKIAHRTTVLDFGEKISEGISSQVLADPRVMEVYLGSNK